MSIYPNLPAMMIHVVFSTRGQEPMITDAIRDLLYSSLSGILESIDCFAVEIGGTPNHVHLLTKMSVDISVDDYLETVKSRSEAWINEQVELAVPFAWQESSVAFSVSRWGAEELIESIRKQEEVHRHKSFQEELVELLKENGIDDYDEADLWD